MKKARILGNETLNRIGLFGGTFDPVHQGHLRAARDVWRAFDLTSVYFIPASIPPHKDYRTYASCEQRLEMIRLAIAEEQAFRVSDIELQRRGPSYTIDTVKAFAKSIEGGAKLFFLLGTDAFFEIDTWHTFKKLFASIPLIVMVRPERVYRDYAAIVDAVGDYLSQKVSPTYRFEERSARFSHSTMVPVYLYTVDTENISSTDIRACIKSKAPIHSFVPSPVEEYIAKRGLYQ